MKLKDKAVEELLEVVEDLQNRLRELEGREEHFEFKKGDIVRKVSDKPFDNFRGEYGKVLEGNHDWCDEGDSPWVTVKFSDGNRNSFAASQLELVWRDK